MECKECHLCGGPLVELGILGALLHLNCRNCGMAYTRRIGVEYGTEASQDGGDSELSDTADVEAEG
jgi:hypothetical protein